ncbi:hypothetical protein Taro_002278 [Colocasia esculenta]|uniref:Uncharacterized protein n=1 Tax=Colocasia esculenta TaxID=4460 RepID=A0A843TDL7_COLES|nr:hypothetical protein [Colocasia esculenta]
MSKGRVLMCGGPAPIPECLSSRVPQVLCEPGTCVVLGVCPDTYVPSRSVSSVLDTLTPVFELYVQLRERRQRAATCVELVLRLVACSALVVGGTDTSRRTGPQLVMFQCLTLGSWGLSP